MKRTALLIITLAVLAKADWVEEYTKRHPNDSSRPGVNLDSCKALQDSQMVKLCIAQIEEQNRIGEPREDAFIYDEQTTVVVSGDETTKTITMIKSRSGKQIAKAINGVKEALYVSIAVSVGLSLIGIIAIASSH